MSEAYLEDQGYGQRWKIESYMSALKRTTGSTLLSRKTANLLKQADFKVLAYALNHSIKTVNAKRINSASQGLFTFIMK